MNRRDVFTITGATVAAAVSANLLACADKKPAAPPPPPTGSATPPAVDPHAGHGGDRNGALAMAAAHCQIAGDVCLAHCLELLATGDTSIAGCARSVREMLAVCGMIGPLAAARSARLRDAAALCGAMCKDCKAECDKHADKHPECKGCADACEQLIAEIGKLA